MADDKKINLPSIRPSTGGLTRRDFLRGTGGAAIEGILDTIPTGRIIDAIGEGDLPSLRQKKEKQLLIELAQLNRSITNTLDKDGLWEDVRDQSGRTTKTWINLFLDPKAYSKALEDTKLKDPDYYVETGNYLYTHEELEEWHEQIESTKDKVISYENKYADKLGELAELHKEMYPKEVFEDLYRLPATRGSNTDPVTGKIALEQGKYTVKLPYLIAKIGQSITIDEDNPERRSQLDLPSLDEDIHRKITNNLPPTVMPRTQDYKDIYREIEDGLPQLEAPEDKIEDRIKKIAGAVGTQVLSRALTQLAASTDSKKKAKGPKQIAGPEKTEKPSINKLLSALSIFKKGTPLGAAAYAMGPTEAGRGSDIVPEDPYEDTWVDSAGNIHLK
jgi:hypothetical protein